MAKQATTDIKEIVNSIRQDILQGSFKPVYLLMGEEPFYVDSLCDFIIEHALAPEERDFNQTILYGTDTNATDIASICSRFPMMAARQLVVIREAQSLKKLDDLGTYLANPADTTVLVMCFTGKSADKRTAFYKNALKSGVVVDSPKCRQEEIPGWIERYVKSLSLGKSISSDAAVLLSESAGIELRKIVLEIDKLLKAVPDSQAEITSRDVENNIGISREFNATELTNALAVRDARKAFRIAYYFGESPKKYPIQMTLGYLFFFFSKVEQIHAYAIAGPRISITEAAKKAGIFYGSYGTPFLTAAGSYPLKKVMKAISLIREYDYKSKSNARGEATDGELLIELIGKIIN